MSGTLPQVAQIYPLFEDELCYGLETKEPQYFTEARVDAIRIAVLAQLGRRFDVQMDQTDSIHVVVESRPPDSISKDSKYPVLTVLQRLLKPQLTYCAYGALTSSASDFHQYSLDILLLGNVSREAVERAQGIMRQPRDVVTARVRPDDPRILAVTVRGDWRNALSSFKSNLLRNGIALGISANI